MISSSGVSWGCHEALFKVRFKHNLLVSHRLIPSSNDRENPEVVTACIVEKAELNKFFFLEIHDVLP